MQRRGQVLSKRERMLRAIKGEPLDRLAVSPRFWKFCRAYYGVYDLPTMKRAGQEFDFDVHKNGHGVVSSCLGFCIPTPDMLPKGVTCACTTTQEGDVQRVHREFATPSGRISDTWLRPTGSGYGVSPAAQPMETLLKGPEDLEALGHLRGRVKPELVQRLPVMYQEMGEDGFVYPYVTSPFNELSYVYPVTDSLMLPYDNPQFLRDILAVLQESCLEDIRACIGAGALSIFLSGFHISQSVGWSPKHFREFFLPLIKEQADLTHGLGALFHYYDDGKCMDILPMLLEVGTDVFETCTPWPAGDFELRAAKAVVGDKMTLMGYVDIENVLHRGTPELVEETVREAVEVLGRDGRFIVGSSDGMLTQTPLGNAKALFAAGKKYGTRAVA